MPALMPVSRPAPALTLLDGERVVVDAWIGKYPKSARAYRKDIEQLRSWLQGSLLSATLPDLQAYVAGLDGAEATRARKASSTRSFYGFAKRNECLDHDPSRELTIPSVKDTLAERIIDESQMLTMIALAGGRVSLMLRLMYRTGCRISELHSMCWKDFKGRDKGGQVTIYGKRGKTRAVILPVPLWDDLVAIRGERGPDDALFYSRHNRPVSLATISRWVKDAAKTAGLENVSPHTTRHAHASHALDRGAPLTLVQQTLGHGSLSSTMRYLHAKPNDSSSMYLVG